MGRKNQVLTILFCAFVVLACNTQKKTATPSLEIRKKTAVLESDTLLTRLLASRPELAAFLDSTRRNEIQVIYTQIDRENDNDPKFIHHYFNVDPDRYFYPASTVKLPVALLALQKAREWNIDPLSTMIVEQGFKGLPGAYNDPTSIDGRPSIANYIKKILLVSDNDAFNRLYEFLGQEYVNNTLHFMGYNSAQILHRLDILLSEEENRHTNPVSFYDTGMTQIYSQPMLKSALVYQPRNTFLGKGFMRGGKLVEEPFDFSKKNRLTLPDLHSIVQSVIFPKDVSSKVRFKLKDEDYAFVRKFMSMYPREAVYPSYDTSYHDADVKFLFYGGKDPVDSNIRIFNKVGQAYGFLIDAAYIIDPASGVEFFLSAVVHCNSDGIYNDNRYDYETVGLPFLRELGRVIYDLELKRPKERKPDLSTFQFDLP